MGKVICAGLGPGDPELMSVKSDRVIRGAKHLAFFRKKGRAGQARSSERTKRMNDYYVLCDVLLLAFVIVYLRYLCAIDESPPEWQWVLWSVLTLG